jgi:hypothetical protein
MLGLPLLEKKGPDWNFRCVICGDSRKSPRKKRGWILAGKPGKAPRYYCFNCGHSQKFISFIKEHHHDVYLIYVKENFKKKKTTTDYPRVKAVPKVDRYDKLELRKLYVLPDDHDAKLYFINRKIHPRWLKYFYYTDSFQEWVNTKIPDKFEHPKKSDKRIVIPFYTHHNRKIFAVAGRSIEKSEKVLRYITIKFDDEHPKVFGLERMKNDRDIFIFEGQLDSLFIPNSIACAGADLRYDYLEMIAPKENYVFVYDLEPRNKEICHRIEKAVKAGYRIALIPEKYKCYGKDVNKMVENGLTPSNIFDIIRQNIFQGSMAEIKFKKWKKIK